MTSVGINAGNDYWKGTDYIERKLGSVLDRRVASSTKQVLLDRIQFKEATKQDPFYTDLKNKYVPLNGSSNKQQNGGQKVSITNRNKGLEVGGNNKPKDELPAPKYTLFEREKIELKWKNVRRVGPGLFNLGNTCFLNSVIQVLTYTPPLVNYLATQEHSKTCKLSFIKKGGESFDVEMIEQSFPFIICHLILLICDTVVQCTCSLLLQYSTLVIL